MKLNRKILVLMTALSIGTVSAASTATPSGTMIKNTANASYDIIDPNPSNPLLNLTSISNEVTTTVLPKPEFDIVFSDGTADSGTQNAIGTTTKTYPNTVPGAQIVTSYSAVNSGNVDLTVALAADATGADSSQVVKYYLAAADTNADGTLSASEISVATDISSINLIRDDITTSGTDEGLVKFFQVVTVPTTATPLLTFGASPAGTVVNTGTNFDSTTGLVTGNGYTATGQEQNAGAGNDLQFVNIAIFRSQMMLFNNVNSAMTGLSKVTNDGVTAVTPPAHTTMGLLIQANNTVDTTPDDPAFYYDPSFQSYTLNGHQVYDQGTIDVSGNSNRSPAIITPVADSDTTADTMTFVHSVGNYPQPSYTTPVDDLAQVSVTAAVNQTTGAIKAGWSFDSTTSTFTDPAGITIQLLTMAGSPLPILAGSTYPSVVSNANTLAYFKTKVTYPDIDHAARPTPGYIEYQLSIDSLKESGFTEKDTTSVFVISGAMQFGDSDTTTGTKASGAADLPVQVVTPNGTFDATPIDSPNTTDSTAAFPMDLVNNTALYYNDTFKLSGTVDFGSGPVAVKYYDSTTGLELGKNTAGDYVSPVVASGNDLKVFAVVNVPANTPSGNYTVSQKAVGVYSTLEQQDNTDIIRVQPYGKLGLAKFTAQTGAGPDTVTTPNGVNIVGSSGYTKGFTSAKPCEDITYQIIAKNEYNTDVQSFAINDAVPLNTILKSVAVTSPTGTSIWKIGAGGTWTTGAITSQPAGTVIYIALDNGATAPKALASGQTLKADFVVTVIGSNCPSVTIVP